MLRFRASISPRRIAIVAGALVVLPLVAHAAVGGDWWTGFGPSGRPGALAPYGDGVVVATSNQDGVNRWTGTEWRHVSGLTGNVTTLAAHGGHVYAAGWVDVDDGRGKMESVAEWDGQLWTRLGAFWDSTGQQGSVRDLAFHGDALIVTGYFDSPAPYVAMWSSGRWSGFGLGSVPLSIRSVAADENTLCILAEYEETTDSTYTWYRTALRWNGASWDTVGSRSDWLGEVAVWNGDIIATGSITATDSSYLRLARWNGSGWQSFPAPSSFGSLSVMITGGGAFFGIDYSRIYRFDGQGWALIGTTDEGSSQVGATNGSSLWVGGSFRAVEGLPASGVACWDGTTWHGALGFGPDSYRLAGLAVHRGLLYIGGSDGTGVGAWDGVGWRGVGNAFADPNTLASLGDSLVAGCDYWYHPSGPADPALTAWNGHAWHAFAEQPDGRVLAICSYQGELIVGGSFTHVGPLEARHIAAWNGVRWRTLGGGVDWLVAALTVYGNDLVVGGAPEASNVGPFITRWTGEQWEPFSGDPGGPVYSLLVYEGQLIAGGSLRDVGGGDVGVMKWTDGYWTPVGDGLDRTVYSLASYHGDLVAGGDFVEGTEPSLWRIARWNERAGWTTFGSGIGATPYHGDYVSAIAVYDDDLYVVGGFDVAGGRPSHLVARWSDDAPAPLRLETLYVPPAFPNPFRKTVTLAYILPHAGRVHVAVYDGRSARRVQLLDEWQEQGWHAATWADDADGSRSGGPSVLPSGIYYVRIDFAGETSTQKIVHLR